MDQEKQKSNWVARVIICGLLVHLFFVSQLIVATNRHGLILPEFGVIFFPPALLMSCLPPMDPWGESGLNLLRLTGKIIDALPASFLYGIIIMLLLKILGRFFNRKRHAR
jgi:hypothetical protein